MSEDYSLYEKIEFYLKGKLSSEEKADFVREMEQDESLRQKVESQEIANNVILTKQLIRLQGKIKKDLNAKKPSSSFKWIIPLTFSAIVISIGVYWFNNKTEQKQDVENVILIKDSVNVLSKKNEIEYIFPITPVKEHAVDINKVGKIQNPIVVSNRIVDSSEVISEDKKLDTEYTSSVSKTVTNLHNKTDAQTKIDCSVLSFEDALSTEPSCVGEQNGKIKITPSNIKGGNAPYLFSISKKTNYKSEVEFQYLNAGNYLVSAKDNNGCIIQKEIEVEEKVCASLNAYAFSPDFEKWEIPFKQNKQGEIKIFNKSGILVYNSMVGVGYENSWDGKSLEGKILDSGYFIYVLKYNDGEEERGSITIR